jgi:hypothetical protein
MAKEQINAMGTLNNRWGVCGFTGALYALYENSPTLRAELTDAAKISTRVIAEVKAFLVHLQADGDAQMLNEIAAFTRVFPGYEGFTIADYLRKVDAVAANGASYAKGDFSIAMPPDAVAAYLQYIGFRNAQVLQPGLATSGKSELLLGLADPPDSTKPHNNLCHWVYQKGATVYSWGRQFKSVEDAGQQGGSSGWSTCVTVSPLG